MNDKKVKDLLEEFLEWARNHTEGIFYVQDNPEEAIEQFIKERE